MIKINAEKKAEIARRESKAARQADVDAITVEVQGKLFDGNEEAQTRMSRAVVAMGDTDETLWVLADNTTALVTRAELQAAMHLAREAQTAIWVRPYQ